MYDHYGAQVRRQLEELRQQLARYRAAWHSAQDRARKQRVRADQAEARTEDWQRAHRRQVGLLMRADVRAEQEAKNAAADEARIAAVRALHRSVQHLGLTICDECSTERSAGPGKYERHVVMPWPCATVAALDGPATTATPDPALVAAEEALTRVMRLAETLPSGVRAQINSAIDGPAEQPADGPS